MRSIFIYYRVKPVHVESAARTVEALFARMTQFCGSPPNRLVRCDDPQTWMEMYDVIADFSSFTRHLDEAVRLLGCHEFIEGERHLESFCIPRPRA